MPIIGFFTYDRMPHSFYLDSFNNFSNFVSIFVFAADFRFLQR
jgi:hypothetical protein